MYDKSVDQNSLKELQKNVKGCQFVYLGENELRGVEVTFPNGEQRTYQDAELPYAIAIIKEQTGTTDPNLISNKLPIIKP